MENRLVNAVIRFLRRSRNPADFVRGIERFFYWNPPKVLLYKLLYEFLTATAPRPLVVQRIFGGIGMLLDPSLGGIHKDLFIYGIREPFSTRILVMELKRIKRGVVVDIGANIGYYALIEAQVLGENGVVYAIEPSLRNLKFLIFNILLNSLQDRVKVRRIAIGDKDDEAFLEIGEAPNLDRGSPLALEKGSRLREQVKMRTLDTFVDEEGLERVDFIRMDVERFEYRIIKGAKRTLERFSLSCSSKYILQ